MKRGLIGAAAVVVVANGFSLFGVWRNRSETVQRIELTELELRMAYSQADSSFVVLRFVRPLWPSQSSEWLNEAKLREIGFDLRKHPKNRAHGESRVVFVVMEYDGDAWRAWEQRRRTEYARPDDRSRLIPVDAGADAPALRDKWPGPRHFIVRGLILARFVSSGHQGWAGQLAEFYPGTVHVPLPWSKLLLDLPPTDAPRYKVTLAWGTRWEPWIEEIKRF